MAVGDSISGVVSVNANVVAWLQPASGDEWRVTAIGDSDDDTRLYFNTDTGNPNVYQIMYWANRGQGANQNQIGVEFVDHGFASTTLHFFLNEDKRIKITSWNAHVFWWMGVKTRD